MSRFLGYHPEVQTLCDEMEQFSDPLAAACARIRESRNDVRTQLAGMLLVAEVRRMSVCRIGADEIAGAIGVTDKLLKALSKGDK